MRGKTEGFFCICMTLVLVSVSLMFCPDLFAQPPSPFAAEKLSGHKAPDFSAKDIQGNQVSLSKYKGNVVILNFWATWCPPCKVELPSLNRLNQAYKGKGLVVIGISTDKSTSAVTDFVSKNPLGFPVLIDSSLTVSRSYKVFMVPTAFIIDRKGLIVEKFFGEQDWSGAEMIKKIEELL